MAQKTGTLLATGTVSLGDGSQEAASTLAIQFTGTWTGTGKVSGTVDGTTYYDLLMIPANSATGVTSATAVGLWRVDVSGLKDVLVDFARTTGTLGYSAQFVVA